jgi:hypothetical protein
MVELDIVLYIQFCVWGIIYAVGPRVATVPPPLGILFPVTYDSERS